MQLKKVIYTNGQKINELNIDDNEHATSELILLLLDAQNKRNKIDITTDNIRKTINANYYFNRTDANNNTINYKYEFYFENVNYLM